MKISIITLLFLDKNLNLNQMTEIGNFVEKGFITLPSALICMLCLYIFIRASCLKKMTMSFTIIIILAISSMILNLLVLFEDFFTENEVPLWIYDTFFYFSIFFTINWAASISYLVYKSLDDINFAQSFTLKGTLLVVTVISAIPGL